MVSHRSPVPPPVHAPRSSQTECSDQGIPIFFDFVPRRGGSVRREAGGHFSADFLDSSRIKNAARNAKQFSDRKRLSTVIQCANGCPGNLILPFTIQAKYAICKRNEARLLAQSLQVVDSMGIRILVVQ